MATYRDIDPTRVGLRSYDITLGFRNLDERNAALTNFNHTHTAGMASLLASTIKGRDIITNAQSLKSFAAEVLKINPWAFDKVVTELADLEMVRDIQKKGGEIISFSERVPLTYDDIHHRIGSHWLDKQPSELESQLLTIIDTLAKKPILSEELRSEIGSDARANQLLRAVGTRSELIQYHSLQDGTEVATSPLYAFEKPNQLINLLEHYSTDRVREVLNRIRMQPGFPVLMNNTDPILQDIIRLGLIPAPTVVGADLQQRAFAIILYGLDPIYLTTKKQVLERALSLIACIRCGEVSGGVTKIRFPDKLLAALMDKNRNYTLGAHSSTDRQYAPLIRMGMIQTVKVGDLLAAKLEPTADNLDAVQLARVLLQRQGEGLPERANERDAAKLLFTGSEYLAPIETISVMQKHPSFLTEREVQGFWAQAMGWSS